MTRMNNGTAPGRPRVTPNRRSQRRVFIGFRWRRPDVERAYRGTRLQQFNVGARLPLWRDASDGVTEERPGQGLCRGAMIELVTI